MQYGIKDIGFDNYYFWFYFLETAYPNGYNEEADVSVGEIIEQIFDIDINKTSNWVNNFTGYYEGVMDESDGYLKNPNILAINLAQDIVFKIEFHPGDTIYYFNDIQIGCTGPHWQLYCLTWKELIEISGKAKDSDYIFLLLLPITAITSEDNLEEIRKLIIEKISGFKAISHEKDMDLVNAIIEGLYIDEGFSEEKDLGVVCKNNYSARFPNVESMDKIRKLNKLLVQIREQ
ncbi:MAG: Imm19 family immunity protein [Bacillota bacterium]|nr:Imm19 family immunity protein [Bacillota bacterium]